MKNNPFINIAFTLLFAILMTACSSSVNKEVRRAEDLATVAPDSAFTILEGIRTEAMENANIKPEFDLVWAEAYYIKNRCITDSIQETISRIETRPDTKQKIMQDILLAIYLYDKNDVENAFSHFETCSREMDGKISLYWECVVEDYMGIISLNAGLIPQSKSHFYKVLSYAETAGDQKSISNANSHISCYYHMTHELDSALVYATKVLSNESVLDSQMLAIAYQNLYYIQISIADSLEANSLDILQLYNKYRISTPDSMVTFAIMTQAYFLHEQFDSAYIYKSKVERGEHNNAKLIMYKFLSDYYQQQELADSALKYLKLYNKMDSLCLRTKSIEPLLNTIYIHNQDEVKLQSKQQKIMIGVISVIIIFVVVILLRIRHKRKIATAYNEIEHKNIQIDALDKQKEQLSDDLKLSREESSKLHYRVNEQEKTIENAELEKKHYREELNNTQKTLQITQTELKQTTGFLSRARRKIESYQSLISKKNSKLAHTSRELEKSDSNKKDHSQSTILTFLDKSTCQEGKMNKNQMQYIIDSYESSSDNRRDFMRSLMRKSNGLTPTGIIICILYSEGFTDEEIISKLNYNPKNFKMAKSRARAAIDLPANSESSFIKALIRKFDYKKSST